MNKLKWIWILCAVAVLYQPGKATAQNTDGENYYICLVDISASESREDFSKYVDVITNTILPKLNTKDYLAIYPIDAGANTKPEVIYEVNLKNESFSKHSDGFTHKADSIQMRLQVFLNNTAKEIENKLNKIQKTRSSQILKTDIFGAINQASNIFDAYVKEDSGDSKLWSYVLGQESSTMSGTLFIFSDMINDTRFGNFDKDNLNGQELINQVTSAYNSNLNLEGIDVLVYGRRAKSSERVEHIKSFWQRFFTTVGGNLVVYGYDSSGQIENYLKKKVTEQATVH
jgi:hypothetical protein